VTVGFDSLTLMLLVRPEGAPALDEEEAARLQDGHLAHLASLHDRGTLVAAGPVLVDDDEPLRGIGLLTCSPEEAAALMAGDPSVQAGRLACRFETWVCPTGALSFAPTTFPRSVADVTG
jgi:uncharacterized protein YciI